MIGNHEPTVDFTQDEVSEPDRDIDAITEVLTEVEKSDVVRVEAGPAEGLVAVNLVVFDAQRDVAGFDYRVNLVEPPRDDGWTRMYSTGLGNDGLDPWELVSWPYHVPSQTADMRDFVANGWIASAKLKSSNEEGSP